MCRDGVWRGVETWTGCKVECVGMGCGGVCKRGLGAKWSMYGWGVEGVGVGCGGVWKRGLGAKWGRECMQNGYLCVFCVIQ